VYVLFGCRKHLPIQRPIAFGSLVEDEYPDVKQSFEEQFGTGIPGHKVDQIIKIDLPQGFRAFEIATSKTQIPKKQ
jgi:hypothetical protein